MSHPPVEILIQHAFGIATVEAAHIAGCPACAGEVEGLAPIRSDSRVLEMPESFEEMVSTFDRERLAARDHLTGLRPSDISGAMRSDGAFRTAGERQALLDAIPSIRLKDPARAFEIARELVLSIEAGSVSDGEAPGNEIHADALRETAACARILGRYDEALDLLEEAEKRAGSLPTGDYLTARIWYERAAIEIAREGSEAREWAGRAAEAFYRFGDLRRYNRSRYLIASSHYNDRDYRQTAEELTRLLPLIEGDRDRETEAAAWSMLGVSFSRDDRIEQASAAFSRAMAAYEHLDRPIDRLRASWGVARTDLKLGNVSDGIRKLETLRGSFMSLNLEEEAALVGLDLAEALLRLGSREPALAACRASMHVLSERFSGREQKRALAYLGEIAGAELRLDDVRHVSEFLFDSVSQPERPFTQPSG